MKHISVIVPSGSSIVDTIIAPFNLLRMANHHFRKINGLSEEPFKIDLVGQTKEPVLYQGLFSIQPTATLKEIRKTDLIIISPPVKLILGFQGFFLPALLFFLHLAYSDFPC